VEVQSVQSPMMLDFALKIKKKLDNAGLLNFQNSYSDLNP
jgi:hypothetical protein